MVSLTFPISFNQHSIAEGIFYILKDEIVKLRLTDYCLAGLNLLKKDKNQSLEYLLFDYSDYILIVPFSLLYYFTEFSSGLKLWDLDSSIWMHFAQFGAFFKILWMFRMFQHSWSRWFACHQPSDKSLIWCVLDQICASTAWCVWKMSFETVFLCYYGPSPPTPYLLKAPLCCKTWSEKA